MTTRRRIVVVGAGSCGCVVAERLTRDESIDVILLEAGPGAADDLDLRLTTLPIGPSSERVVHHRAAGDLHLPRGRGLGGSSVVNGGYFMRWHADDFADWDTERFAPDDVARAYAAIDGGTGGGGAMSVRRLDDGELHPWARAFERYWQRTGYDIVDDVTPGVGVNRVRSNSTGMLRFPADRAYLRRAQVRPNLSVRTDIAVDRLVLDHARVSGVRTRSGDTVTADETILCAGTLASAALIARSTGVGATHRIAEHRELLVRFRPAADSEAVRTLPLLPTVLHTDDRLEIRCYNGDFADHIDGVPRTGPAIGVALMAPRARGTLSIDPTGEQQVDLGAVDPADAASMRGWADRVVAMLDDREFAGFVETGSGTVDAEIRTSQHAWGSMPMGGATDWHGAVAGVSGLRVIDGSILPSSGSSGPHETLMMMAAMIADVVARH